MRQERNGGFSVIELMVTLVIVVVFALLAVPSFSSMLDRSRLRSATEQLRVDLTLARTEALRRDDGVVVSFVRNDATSWCWGMRVDASCDCTQTSGAELCFLDRDGGGTPIRRVVSSVDYRGVRLDALPFGGALAFNAVRPTLASGSASFSAGDYAARVAVGNVGRIRTCSVSGPNYLYYFDPC